MFTRRYAWLLLVIVLAVVAIAAGIFVIGGRSSTIEVQLQDVQSIRIQDSWSGLSRAAPIEADYTFIKEGDSFSGTANFSVAGGGFSETNGLSDSAAISIPADTINGFLTMLEEARLRLGEYEPRIEWTDDYPSIRITIETATDTIVIYTGSQGEEHIPWGATYRHESYVIDSGVPAQALALLEPFLHKEILDNLIDQANTR